MSETQSRPGTPTLPTVVWIAVAVTFFNTWVLFEETVIDRYGLWEYLPYYRYGQVCAWDIGAIILIGALTYRALRRRRGGRQGQTPQNAAASADPSRDDG